MNPNSERWRLRAVLFVLLVISSAYLGYANATDTTRNTIETYHDEAAKPVSERVPVVDERNAATIITSRGAQAYAGTDALYVFGGDGRLQYFENRTQYADVDVSPAGNQTVQVAADTDANISGCERRCSEQMIRRINYSTGAAVDVYRFTTPGTRDSNWHDIDRLSEDQYLIAGIHQDEIYRINTTTGVREWQWSMQSNYQKRSGGPYPADWAHMNDVEKLPDGRLMASPRNHDQVVFIDPETGLQENWTLGCDDCFGTLYEQHNPDYIPAEQGGPAVLVADSENNRVVEYQRVNDTWQRSWVFQSDSMDWPRDADRLPNGHTLITDTHADRVYEVDRSGDIVWKVHIPNGYEAERLGTGDESANGPSAVRANLTNVTSDSNDRASIAIANEGERSGRSGFGKLWHGIQFVLPSWVGGLELLFAVEVMATLMIWGSIELYWRGVRVRTPVRLRRSG